MDQPVFNSTAMKFDSGFGLGDVLFDMQYGTNTEPGFLWSLGATATFPTATEKGLGGKRWGLGPSFQLGRVRKSSVVGGFINHQWDLGGSVSINFGLC